MLIFRGLVGFGLGGVPVSFNLFLEFIPAAHRGQYSIILEAFWAIGALLEAGLAWTVMPTLGWRALIAFSTLPLSSLIFKLIN